MSMDKEDDDYEGSYWEYLDVIIEHRKNNPSPIIKAENLVWRELIALIKRDVFNEEELIRMCKMKYYLAEK